MSGYNFGTGIRARELRAAVARMKIENEKRRWPEERLLELSDIVADSKTDDIAWTVAAFAFECDAAECKRAFARVIDRIGWQAS